MEAFVNIRIASEAPAESAPTTTPKMDAVALHVGKF